MNSGSTTSASSVSRHSSASIVSSVVTSTTTLLTTLPSVLVTAVWAPTTSLLRRLVIAPVWRAGEERHRHPLHLGEQRPPQVVDQPLADAGAAPALHDRQAGVAQRGGDRQPGEPPDQRCGRRSGIASSRIWRTTNGGTSAEQRGDEDRREEQRDRAAVRAGEPPHPAASCRAASLVPFTASASRGIIVWGPMRITCRLRPARRRAIGVAGSAPSLVQVLRRVARRGGRAARPRPAPSRGGDATATTAESPAASGDASGRPERAARARLDDRRRNRPASTKPADAPRTAPVRATADRVDAVQRRCRRRHARGADRLQRSERADVRAPPGAPQRARSRRTDRHVARQPWRARVRRQRARAASRRASTTGRCCERFDIIGWDPRGTGAEHAGDRLRRRLRRSTSPVDDHAAERRRARSRSSTPPRSFVERLREPQNADILQHVGTNDSARDMDVIRAGARRGQDLLLRLQLRQRARRGLGDAVPRHRAGRCARRRRRPRRRPASSRNLEQTKGFEGTLDTFLAQCSDDASCAFHNRRRRRAARSTR